MIKKISVFLLLICIFLSCFCFVNAANVNMDLNTANNTIDANTITNTNSNSVRVSGLDALPEAQLGLTNILCILLIVVGILLLLLGIAILIRLKNG